MYPLRSAALEVVARQCAPRLGRMVTHYSVRVEFESPCGQLGAVRRSDAPGKTVAVQGYEVISLRPERQGYLEEVKRLAEQVESQMATAETDPWAVAIQIPLTRTDALPSLEDEEEAPF